MADSQAEKQLKPTPKRLRDARKRGQIARSRDLSSAVALLAAVAVLSVIGHILLGRLQGLLAGSLGRLDELARTPATADGLSRLMLSHGYVLAMTTGPIAIAAALVGVSASVAQGGFNLSVVPLQPRWDRLSPRQGLRRLAPSRSGIDTLKWVVAAIAIAWLAWHAGSEVAFDAPRLVGSSAASAAGRAWSVTGRLLWQAAAALVAIGMADYGVQRWRLMSSLRMTRQEVQDEARHEEGRPEVKARVRRIQRDLARRRMLRATAKATVVVTNPTHFAVALEYRREKNPAPVVVAKGKDQLAARIREIARSHDVPIVENPALARALYGGAEVGDVIPVPLFGAVAEMLAYLVRIRQLVF